MSGTKAYRWEIEATVTRAGFTPDDGTAIGRLRVAAQDAPTWQADLTVSRTDLLALLDAHAQRGRLHNSLLAAALGNADRMSQLESTTGRLIVEADRLRALAYPITEEAPSA